MGVETPVGRVLRDEDGVRVEFHRVVAAPVEEVWAALTHPDRTALWFGTWSGDPASGTITVVMSAEDGAPAEAVQVDRCERPARLELTMGSAERPWPVTVGLTQDGAATVLRFVHRLVEPEEVSSIGPGWHFYLDRLAAVAAGTDVPDVWDDYYPELSEAYATPST